MVETWVLWIPVIATGVGALIGFGSNLATTFVAARMQERREQAQAQDRELDAALAALKEAGRQMQREIVYPSYPSLRTIRPVHDFAYDVARRVPDAEATDQWLAAFTAVQNANKNIVRVLAWRLLKVGGKQREALIAQFAGAELAMALACERLRPPKRVPQSRPAPQTPGKTL
jgi:hypothetical protein